MDLLKLKTILVILVTLILSGCVTQKACEKKFPPEKIRVDSIIKTTETVYRDTTIFIYLEGDTVYSVDTVFVKEGIANSLPSIHETDLIWSKAQVINNRLIHEVRQKDSVLAIVIEKAIKESAILNEKIKIEEKIVQVNYLTSFQHFEIWLGRIFAILLFLFIGYKVIRYKLKLPI